MKVVGYVKKTEGKPLCKETVIEFPGEQILNSQVCLKEDHVDNLAGEKPNFRNVGGLYGVAQPTEKGIAQVLDRLGKTHRRVYWTNMRSEPTVFIQGESYTLRTKDNPHPQLEYQGASREKVERFETAMKQEILGKTRRGEPLTLCRDEESGEKCLVRFDPGSIDPREVKTTAEVFGELKTHYNLDYQRVPVNDRTRPTHRDIDFLVERYNQYDPRDAYVTNCMAGMGRTTTSMVLLNIMNHVKQSPEINFCRIPGIQEQITGDGRGKFGRLRAVFNITRLAEKISDLVIGGRGGDDFQTILDAQSIGKCHIREALPGSYDKDPQKGKDYLDSYLHLTFFHRYCREQAPDDFARPFSQWMKQYEKPVKLLTEILDRAFRVENRLKKLF